MHDSSDPALFMKISTDFFLSTPQRALSRRCVQSVVDSVQRKSPGYDARSLLSPGALRGEHSSDLDTILNTAVVIAKKRRGVLARLRAALKANDAAEVFHVAKELCGLYDDKTGN